MNLRLVAFSSLLLAVGRPSFATESWDCRFSDLVAPMPNGGTNSVKIEIDGERLDWILEMPVIGPDFGPVPDGKGGYQHKPVTWHFSILQNNDVGIVAASAESQIDRQAGTLVGAEVIDIDRTTGKLYVGSVMLSGPHANMSGQCKRN